MQTTMCILEVRDFVEKNICPLIHLKQACDYVHDGDYPYKLVIPKCYAMYPDFADTTDYRYPSCVVVTGREDSPVKRDLVEKWESIPITLVFGTWNPGQHSQDVFYPVKDANGNTVLNEQGQIVYRADSSREFQKSIAGWEDAWNFADVAERVIGNVQHFGKHTFLDQSVEIKKGDASAYKYKHEFYPYFFTYISFNVLTPASSTHEFIKPLLDT